MIIKFDDIVPRPFPDDTSQENYWLHRTIMSGIFIDWQWVKGHSDNKYNDEVDFLAKTGLKLDE